MREEILKYLGTVMQSTAKTLSEKLCLDRLSVSRELNSMVGDGILERKLEGAGGRHSEYVYWLTRKDAVAVPQDGVDMHPKTLPAGAMAIPKPAPATVEKPEVTEAEVNTVEEALDLALQLQAVTRERDELQKKFMALADKATVLQLTFDKQTKELESQKSLVNRSEERITTFQSQLVDARNDVGQLTELRRALDDAVKRADEWKAKHDALQLQIDEYDERQRFEVWFGKRPESKGSPDSTSLKEKMWESWLERSKLIEVAA